MKVLISAGGTGGHIYPALAIINKIKEMEPDSTFLYIGTHNRMENEIVPNKGIPFKTLEVYGLSKKIFKNFKVLDCFRKSYKKALSIISEYDPDIVIGVGGYVTVPVIMAAHKLGYKTFLHEQNSIAGKANKFLAKYASLVGVSFASSAKYFKKTKVVLTGNPCATNAITTKSIPKSKYGLTKDKKLVLIVMGSLGASTVNKVVVDAIPNFKNKDYEVLFVTGNGFKEKIKNIPSNVKVVPYVDNMAGIMKSVDVMVSRAGASTLSEILALNVPSVLIPSPFVPNNHQYINALDLVDNNAALMLEEKDLNKDTLINNIDALINDKTKIKEMKKNLDKMAIKDSSDIIYKELKGMMERG